MLCLFCVLRRNPPLASELLCLDILFELDGPDSEELCLDIGCLLPAGASLPPPDRLLPVGDVWLLGRSAPRLPAPSLTFRPPGLDTVDSFLPGLDGWLDAIDSFLLLSPASGPLGLTARLEAWELVRDRLSDAAHDPLRLLLLGDL